MAQVIVRNLDERVVATLRCTAELQPHSLEQELRDILSVATQLTGQERVVLVRRIRAMTPPYVPQTDSTDLIHKDRDQR